MTLFIGVIAMLAFFVGVAAMVDAFTGKRKPQDDGLQCPECAAEPEGVEPARMANRYVFGKHFFAEWTEDGEDECDGEGWEIFCKHFSVDGDGDYVVPSTGYYTDTEENARLLIDMFDESFPRQPFMSHTGNVIAMNCGDAIGGKS